ncbi:MAG: acetyl-CoA carboxylase biotin carboxylase subunit, partial [Solirubrobacterales bacterium]|nr:acetyl-CoA carboxylase biotin carboxylase subunit [Solirubrobacterales bacterium]
AVAEGRSLRFAQEDIAFQGHAMECRINAEDWHLDFRPSPGTIESAVFPVGPDIRVDTHIESGSVVPPYYDSLLAKLIVHGTDRRDAFRRTRRALRRCRIRGVATTLDVHEMLLDDQELAEGGVDTLFFARFLESRLASEMTTSGA